MGRAIVAGGKVGMEAPSTGIALSTLAEGSIVKLNENGSPVEFYVAKHNYESSLNGTGRTLLVRKDVLGSVVWRADNVNVYDNSTLDQYFNNTYKALLDEDVQNAIGTTSFYCSTSSTVSTLTRSIFALSVTELGITFDFTNVEGSALPTANLLSGPVYLSGSHVSQWTRTRYTYTALSAACTVYDGSASGQAVTNSNYPRPAFTLPSTAIFDGKTLLFKGVA